MTDSYVSVSDGNSAFSDTLRAALVTLLQDAFPLVIGAVTFTIMTTWGRGGKMLLAEARVRASTPLKPYLTSLRARSPARVGGTAIFLTPSPEAVPHALVNNLIHNRVLNERVVFLTMVDALANMDFASEQHL